MRKLLTLLLVLAILAPAFADDAKVLPKGVFRTYFVFASDASDQAYGSDGEKQDSAEMSSLSLGVAVEYGVTDQISAAIQWTPAYIFNSKIDPSPLAGGIPPFVPPLPGDVNFDGLADLFVGAKVQILGPDGFVPNEAMRFALALGALIPLDNPDWDEETTAALGGDDYKISSPSNQAVGLGFRLYFDYILSEMFFLNLYNETIFYLPTEQASILAPTTEVEYKYGYKATFEFEPHFEYPLGDGFTVSAGLPATFVMTPEVVEDGVGDGLPTYILKLNPNVSAFIMTPILPIEVKASYAFPLLGKNTSASSTLVFQLKAYLKF